MQEKIIFREMLSEIKELADQNGNILTVEEIKDFFSNTHLTEEQLSMVYEYLISQKIQVEGYTSRQTSEPEEEIQVEVPEDFTEDEYMRMYLEDLEGIVPVTEEEEEQLFEKAALGDKLARSRLVELYLRTVCDVARTFRYSELPQSDLIQEGNVALMLALDQLELLESLDTYRKFLFDSISKAMEEALLEQKDLKEMDKEIAERVNHLSEAVSNLERDLEHKVSIEELSAYLEMPLEEIKVILRMAGDKIDLAGGEPLK